MERITFFGLLVLGTLKVVTYGFPINNGFSVKFGPISPKEDIKTKAFGAIFAKIPQELEPETLHRRDILANAYEPPVADLGEVGATNQIGKIGNNLKNYLDINYNDTQSWDNENFIHLPIIQQPYQDYKILVATAPAHMKLSNQDDGSKILVYVIFPETEDRDGSSYKIPTIYFVNKLHAPNDLENLSKSEPLLIVDSNRTVTGIKSKQISKFIKFRNKLRDRYNYKVVR